MKPNKQRVPVFNTALTRLALTVALAASLAACSTIKAPNDSNHDTAASALGLSQDIQDRYAVDGAWWYGYQDPQLNHLIQLALANNTDLASSAIRVNQALYQANLSGVDLSPTLSGSVTGSVKQDLKNGGHSIRYYGGDLKVSYELDLWQKLANSKSAKTWAYQASLADKESLRLTTIYAVIDVYFQLSSLNAQLDNAKTNIEIYQSQYKVANSKYRLGRVASIEANQAQQSVLNAQNQLLNLQKQYAQSIQALNNLLNQRGGETVDVAIAPLEKIQPMGVDLNVPLAVIANRPDLRAAEFRLQQGFKSWQATSKSWYPSVSLSAMVNSKSQNVGSALKFPIGMGSIDVSLPFLDWQTVKWNIKISEADYELNRLNFEKAITEAVNEVVNENHQYQQALASEKNWQAKVATEQKIARYYQVRYQQGKDEQAKWLMAQNSLNDAKLSLLQSRYNRIVAENKVYKAMAGRYLAK